MEAATRLALLLAGASAALAFVPINPINAQVYQLSYDYSGQKFFDSFDFFSDKDPTNGHVKYVNMTIANSTSLAGFVADADTDPQALPVYLGVDYTTPAATDGRASVRVSSKRKFNHSLVIADILHMPAPVCGTWPAYWMLGTAAEWPAAGEIDILENINEAIGNKYTLHTNAGIKVSNYTGTSQAGRLDTADCDVNGLDQPKNVGCSVSDCPLAKSYGDVFNKNDGGVFATLLDASGVQIWFFSRNDIPDDITAGVPNPPGRSMIGPGNDSTWPIPNARFDGPGNNFDAHFKDMQIIFNTAFCGDWAGKVWNTSSCALLAPTCEQYVSENPGAFEEVYWAINSVKVYEMGPGNQTVPYDGKGDRIGKRADTTGSQDVEGIDNRDGSRLATEHLRYHQDGWGSGHH